MGEFAEFAEPSTRARVRRSTREGRGRHRDELARGVQQSHHHRSILPRLPPPSKRGITTICTISAGHKKRRPRTENAKRWWRPSCTIMGGLKAHFSVLPNLPRHKKCVSMNGASVGAGGGWKHMILVDVTVVNRARQHQQKVAKVVSGSIKN